MGVCLCLWCGGGGGTESQDLNPGWRFVHTPLISAG